MVWKVWVESTMIEAPEATPALKFNATFCLLNLIVESAFVSQNITSVSIKVSGLVLGSVECGSLFDFEHPVMPSITNRLNILTAQRKLVFELTPAKINILTTNLRV